MDNAIQIVLVVNVANGAFRDMFSPGQINVDQAAVGRGGYVQSIGTSEEIVQFGDVVTAGYLVLRNLDETNWVEYGPESGGAMVSFGKLKPGEVAVLRLKPGVVMRAKADSGAVKLDVRLYED